MRATKKIAFWLLRGGMLLLGALPLKVHYALARVLAWMLESVVCYRYSVVTINLARCFPDCSSRQIASYRTAFYRHMADMFAEALFLGGCRKPGRFADTHMVKVVNTEAINNLHSRGKGVVSLFGHLGNWEILSAFSQFDVDGEPLAFKTEDVAIVYKALKSEVWDELISRNRQAPLQGSFEGYLETRQILRYAINHKADNKLYFLLSDQRPYAKSRERMTVDFMGRECATMAGGAALASKFGMSVAYMSMRLAGRGHYELEFKTICEDASQMSEQEIMQKYYNLLEQDIKAQPENYLWSHRRWR